MSNDQILKKILKAKEDKVAFQQELLKNNELVVSIMLNVPGVPKFHDKQELVLNFLVSVVQNILSLPDLKILQKDEWKNELGLVSYVVIQKLADNFSVFEFKKNLIFLEEACEWARIFDLDIYVVSGPIARRDLSLTSRYCYICNDIDFNNCVKSSKHTYEELRAKYFSLFNECSTKFEKLLQLGSLAAKSILEEVELDPKPGLVTLTSKGSHQDMNFDLFKNSTKVLAKYFPRFLALPLKPWFEASTAMIDIKRIGLEIEQEMFKVTKGVNTQKGLVFIYGVLLTAVALIDQDYGDPQKLKEIIKQIAKDIFKEFDSEQYKDTHGYKIYKEYGFGGAREFVKSGMELAFKTSSELENIQDDNVAYKLMLLYIISQNNDTNILWRSKSQELLTEIKSKAKKYYETCLLMPNMLDEVLKEFNEFMISKNLSPGGSADILCVSIFLRKFF